MINSFTTAIACQRSARFRFPVNLWSNCSPFWLRRYPIFNRPGLASLDQTERHPLNSRGKRFTLLSTPFTLSSQKLPFWINSPSLSTATVEDRRCKKVIWKMRDIGHRWRHSILGTKRRTKTSLGCLILHLR